ncbi:hypothetical protein ACTQ4K_09550 [Clostridium sporogenes]|uniref:hypothetical protein n=1 Tax=Clostridium sporogenes TaxID=1509 RepID=UPI003F8E9132
MILKLSGLLINNILKVAYVFGTASLANNQITAGDLSMAFGCSLRAPHGGIFVLPVISNPFGYFVALVIGSLIGMLVLGILKKKIQ